MSLAGDSGNCMTVVDQVNISETSFLLRNSVCMYQPFGLNDSRAICSRPWALKNLKLASVALRFLRLFSNFFRCVRYWPFVVYLLTYFHYFANADRQRRVMLPRGEELNREMRNKTSLSDPCDSDWRIYQPGARFSKNLRKNPKFSLSFS